MTAVHGAVERSVAGPRPAGGRMDRSRRLAAGFTTLTLVAAARTAGAVAGAPLASLR